MFTVLLFFQWICRRESDLPVLFLRHLDSSPQVGDFLMKFNSVYSSICVINTFYNFFIWTCLLSMWFCSSIMFLMFFHLPPGLQPHTKIYSLTFPIFDHMIMNNFFSVPSPGTVCCLQYFPLFLWIVNQFCLSGNLKKNKKL